MNLKYIDAIRGIAILGVIIVHTGQYGFDHYPLLFDSLIKQGARGVQLFYIASAFTLFLSFNYRKNLEERADRNFFIRRFFRIAPMYYIGIVYYLWQNGFGPRHWLGDAESITVSNIISNVFFVHGINPYWITSVVPGGWSITVEMTFYAIVPLLVRRIQSTNQAVGFTIFSFVLSLVLRLVLQRFPLISDEQLWTEYLFLYFPNQLPVFGLGIIAYFLIINNDKKVSSLNFLLLSIILAVDLIWGGIPPHILFGVAFLALMVSLSKNEILLLVNKPTIFLGKISYSSYLVHFAVLHWMGEFEFVDFIAISTPIDSIINYLIRLIVVLFLTSIISWGLLKIIEQPFQKIGKKIVERLSSEKLKVLAKSES